MAKANPDPSEELDVRPVTPNTIPEISRLTGYSEAYLRKEYDKSVQRGDNALMVLISALSRAAAMDAAAAYANSRCYYFQRNSGEWICMIHNQNSRFRIAGGSRLPCRGVLPDE